MEPILILIEKIGNKIKELFMEDLSKTLDYLLNVKIYWKIELLNNID